jgi:hypothetical protein
MSDLTERLPVRLAHAWVALYTRGLPADRRDARRAEITSDVWEHRDDHARDGSDGVAGSVLSRVLAGMPADISWRVEERGIARKESAIAPPWHGQRVLRRQIIIIPGIAVLAGMVALLSLPGAAAALLAGLMILALVGLMRGLLRSPVGTAAGTGAHMETRVDHRRRATLLIVLAVSVIVLAGTYAYAMSLEHWGDTRALIFLGLGWGSLAVGLVALVLLVADVVRARRS